MIELYAGLIAGVVFAILMLAHASLSGSWDRNNRSRNVRTLGRVEAIGGHNRPGED